MKTRGIIILTYLCISFSSIVYAADSIKANDQETPLAQEFYQAGDSLSELSKFEEAIVQFQIALESYQNDKNWEKSALCNNKISESYWKLYKEQEVLQYANEALKICRKYFTKNHRQAAYAYSNISKYHELKSQFDQSLAFQEKALSIRLEILPANHSEIIKSYWDLGILNYILNNHEKALSDYHKALEGQIEREGPENKFVALVYRNIGVVYSEQGKQEEALDYYNKGLEVFNGLEGDHQKNMGSIYLNMGVAYKAMSMFNEALNYYLNAANSLDQNSVQAGIIYLNLGNLYVELGKLDLSISYKQKALNLLKNKLGDLHYYTSGAYMGIGESYFHKEDYDKAFDYYSKTLRIRKEIYGEVHPEVSSSYASIGYIHENLNNYQKALDFHLKSLESLPNKDINLARLEVSYKNLSKSYFFLKNYEKSEEFLTRALQVSFKFRDKDDPNIAHIYNKYGELFEEQQAYEKALQYYQKAVALVDKRQEESKEGSFTLLASFIGIGETLKKSYLASGDVSKLKSSIESYEKGEVTIKKQRNTLFNYNDKLGIAKLTQSVYQGLVETHTLLGAHGQHQEAFIQSFYYSEKSKSNALREIFLARNANKFAGIHASLQGLEDSLRTKRAYLLSKLLEKEEGTDTLIQSALQQELFLIDKQYDSLITQIEQESPDYYHLKYSEEILSIEEIQENLPKDKTLLEYFVADSVIYAFVINKDTFLLKKLTAANLSEKVTKLRNTTIEKDVNGYKSVAHELYEMIIRPVKAALREQVTIVPDGSLWHLNFELLLTNESESRNYKQLPYLLREHVISYANSINLLYQKSGTEDKETTLKECLAFSYSDSTTITDDQEITLSTLRKSDEDLPGTRKEISSIAKMIDGVYYFGKSATETNFKQHAKKYAIIHLALHGEIDEKEFSNSRLFFTNYGDSLEDNTLYSHELFTLDIPAELAVLSACNTGNGKLKSGEGIMSLGNAFQYAGTRSLLLSRWDISDQTTPQLMTYFYEYLKEGMTKSVALQQAKLRYLDSTSDFHQIAPFYWGSFYLLGNEDPITFNKSNDKLWVYFIGASLLMLALVYLRKRGIL